MAIKQNMGKYQNKQAKDNPYERRDDKQSVPVRPFDSWQKDCPRLLSSYQQFHTECPLIKKIMFLNVNSSI